MVGIIALITLDFSFHHPSIDNNVLAEALPDTRPTRITTQVNHGIIHPRTVSCTTLISSDFSTCLGQFCIECRTDIDRLREKRPTLCIGHAVVMVKTVDIGNTKVLHRFLLNNPYPLLPLFNTWCPCSRSVEDGTHFPFGNERVEHVLVEFPYSSGLPLVDVHRETAQSFDDLLIGHLQQILDILRRSAILLKHGTHLVTVNLRIFNGHLSHDIQIQFQHLSDFLIERHLRQCLLDFRLQFFVTRNGRFTQLCPHPCNGTCNNDC